MAKILLVEDDKSLREIYGVRLIAEGYTVVSAGDGEEALAVAIKERPDLIVSDVMMPKISGFDMLDILRSTTETKDIKVIMMTALSSEDQRARGEALGADRYLVKSQVGIEDVVRTVHDVLGDGVAGAAPAAPAFPAASTPASAPTPSAPQPAAPEAAAPLIADVMPTTSAPAPVTPIAPPAPQLPPAPVAPSTAPFISEPIVQPGPLPTPQPQPTPTPVAPAAPQPAAPAPVAPTPLPAPTAPFSSNPPASLGDRIINPLPTADALAQPGIPDIASQMNQELNAQLQNLQQPPQAPEQPPMAPQPPQPGI